MSNPGRSSASCTAATGS